MESTATPIASDFATQPKAKRVCKRAPKKTPTDEPSSLLSSVPISVTTSPAAVVSVTAAKKREAHPAALEILKLWRDACSEVTGSKRVLLKSNKDYDKVRGVFTQRYGDQKKPSVPTVAVPSAIAPVEEKTE